ncbi:hypothetical protein C2E23DRAFT_723172 [Lenzites betulinus]|nr:hypothetical protein C2E23DRAFT_723172 [Lenzites betulinus]
MSCTLPLLIHSTYTHVGTPCTPNGLPLPPNTPPLPRQRPPHTDYSPFDNRAHFECADFLFRKEQMSGGKIDALMDILNAFNQQAAGGAGAPFTDANDLYETIDQIPLLDVPWWSFSVSYTGPRPDREEDVPKWMKQEYVVWYRCPDKVLKAQLGNPDFKGEMDWSPKRVYNKKGQREYQDLMSGDWCWEQADTIAEDPGTHGATFCPIILGSDKTTVSVATGQNDYWPLYISNGLVHNNVRRARRNAVSVVAFLAIPTTDREFEGDAQFRKFRRQLFHDSLRHILLNTLPGMSRPQVILCSDNHYRRVIYGIGPYIGDYPEQTLVACVVQKWCAKCTASRLDLNGPGIPRSHEHTRALAEVFPPKILWDDYGIVHGIEPFTTTFPRANIHEVISPDLLHQVIKGTFKDHLVKWVEEYLVIKHGVRGAAVIMADIDRRIAVVPSFTGLRRFPEGRRFKQWTGDDSKALMKVFIPAIAGYVPPKILQCFRAFLDFCYLVRRHIITSEELEQIEDAIQQFYEARLVFAEAGCNVHDFSIPRQHSISHYPRLIQQFAAPNGLCSSITESKHIQAVKEPWRRSNRFNALGQMLLTNQRLDKLAAARVDFYARGMLDGPLTGFDNLLAGFDPAPPSPPTGLHPAHKSDNSGDEEDIDTLDGGGSVIVMAKRKVPNMPKTLTGVEDLCGCPNLGDLIQDYLQLCEPGNLLISTSFTIYPSVTVHLYAPNEQSSPGGIYREHIRSVASWRQGPPRQDCAFVKKSPFVPALRNLAVVRVVMFFSFRTVARSTHECALVTGYTPVGEEPDQDTGMWIVKPQTDTDDDPVYSVLSIHDIIRAAHLIGHSGNETIPNDLLYTDALNAFSAFYVNKYIDYHAHTMDL